VAALPGSLPVAGARRNHVSEKSPPDGSGGPLPRDRRPAQTPVATTRTEVAPSVTGGSDRTARRADRPTTAVYGARTPRRRRTNLELAELHDALLELVAAEQPVTLRGAYYRAVSSGVVDKTEAGYKLVGREILKLRRSHRMPYRWITDGTRWISKPTSYDDADQALNDLASSYRRALWQEQDATVHVFTEKDAISGVIYPITDRWDVPLAVLRGYCSETFAFEIAEDLAADSRTSYCYGLGDHDPSGVDAWRDLQAKVLRFAPDANVVFERLAVTPEQVTVHRLPTRPTKTSDTRAAGFRGESVEVDALPPTVLRTLVDDAIAQHIDPRSLALTRAVEASERDGLEALAGRWL